MKLLCFLWTSADGQVAVYSDGSYEAKTCSTSTGHTVPPGGRFRLGGQHSFDGNIYNLRLWDYAMTVQQLSALSCDSVGNVIDWDNGHWDIPSSLAQTDATLSCSEKSLTQRRFLNVKNEPTLTLRFFLHAIVMSLHANRLFR
eukprot:XP_011610081.1 PREDICTED: G-protein coupled receptor 126-like [Takifugu rubripes]